VLVFYFVKLRVCQSYFSDWFHWPGGDFSIRTLQLGYMGANHPKLVLLVLPLPENEFGKDII